MKKLKLDAFGNKVIIPSTGQKVLRDGNVFCVTGVFETGDLYTIASVILQGKSGQVEIGYYDFIKHEKAD